MSDVNSSAVELSREELLRYGRHLVLPEVGIEGQRRLIDLFAATRLSDLLPASGTPRPGRPAPYQRPES